ncbi:hypothetical protein ACJJI4_04280 [Microbulbifer sp. TRSA002]|uniref:hypothetical protein n=1 Tax=Microbulbifer sp. TRSA002 TaxID=3243382 RepID=UPI004039D4D7
MLPVVRQKTIMLGKEAVMGFGGISIWQLIILLMIVLFFVVPVVHVLVSSRSHGGAKVGWFLGVFFFSWLVYAVFLIVTQPVKDAQKSADKPASPPMIF